MIIITINSTEDGSYDVWGIDEYAQAWNLGHFSNYSDEFGESMRGYYDTQAKEFNNLSDLVNWLTSRKNEEVYVMTEDEMADLLDAYK